MWTWVWVLGAFILGYGCCWVINLDNIEEGKIAKRAEEERLDTFIKELKAEQAARHIGDHLPSPETEQCVNS